jgi:pyrimidine-nucleoside phosphorylase
MNFLSLIEAKRDGKTHDSAEVRAIVSEFVAGKIPDYQMAAWLMAVYFRGLTKSETAELTSAMVYSGENLHLKFPLDPRPLVDKHSTGGVGDKVSLPLAPLLACLGFRVPMISGRGLGITGGTLDKLESIPGFTTGLDFTTIIDKVQSVGCVICGQTAQMVPADRLLYALRDATGTVPSIPLIAASILSKKLTEGLDALVFDVKFGSAAFMPTVDKANELAVLMVELINRPYYWDVVSGRALLTNMNSPLGRAAGNWLEVREAVDCLEGQGPPDLLELVLAFAASLLVQTRKAANLDEGRAEAESCLNSGEPRRKWDEMLAAQGADLDAFNRKLASNHHAPVVRELKSERGGRITRCEARLVGEVIRDLGGGRITKDSGINHDVGVDMLAKRGDDLTPSSILCRVHAASEAQAESALVRLKEAFVTDTFERVVPLIAGTADWEYDRETGVPFLSTRTFHSTHFPEAEGPER